MKLNRNALTFASMYTSENDDIYIYEPFKNTDLNIFPVLHAKNKGGTNKQLIHWSDIEKLLN